jgi:hypothetical protein
VSQLQQHSYCDVTGSITPQTHFDVVLPTATWQGDYLQHGCGGFCGLNAGSQSVNLVDPSRTSLNQASWAPLLNGELVVGADDQGHRAATNGDALWAKNDAQLRVVFGYTSEHSMLTVAKALMKAFYGRGPAYTYFDGVSDGGHEALDLAQRYPNDFNGILAGAPANNWAGLAGVDETWQTRTNMDASDMGIPPQTSLDYYSAVLRFMGGYALAQKFSRLYMIPGLYHCPCGRLGGGDPETHPQFMDQLVAWVEHGHTPAAVTFPVTRSTSPNPPHDITVRPLNPLTHVPHNHGLNSNYHYALKGLVYNPKHQLWCQPVGRRLVCSRRR